MGDTLKPRPNTDDADPDVVLAEVQHCASCWEGGVRLLGNVRAADIVRAIATLLREHISRNREIESLRSQLSTAQDLAALRLERQQELHGEVDGLRSQLSTAQAEIAEREASFELQWKASRRATTMWQAAHPERGDVWPDTAHLIVWLMEQLDARESKGVSEGLRIAARDAADNPILLTGADLMAGAVVRLVDAGALDARSELADLALDYGGIRHDGNEPIAGVRKRYAELRSKMDGRWITKAPLTAESEASVALDSSEGEGARTVNKSNPSKSSNSSPLDGSPKEEATE